MKAYFVEEPTKFTDCGNFTVYRYDIKQVDESQWEAMEVHVYCPVTTKKVVSTIISDKWGLNHEQKLVNEYNSVTFGIITGEEAQKVQAEYKQFLSDRLALKASVEEDCAAYGLPYE